ncbi:MAG: hypothetical protein GTO02_09625 [Candidatus Dadabacteria bacterium]|nr:hypothetical protein [Candidatus Dadabacteria bacterium]NIQ14636.1 hypothetical protein [Candidatus Dadabacteria bacterium]
MKNLNLIFFIIALLFLSVQANAVTQMIGDDDGFGIDPLGLVNYLGAPADTNGNGIIEPGEFLPDWDLDNVVDTSNDDFDERSFLEELSAFGPVNTDVSLSTSSGIGPPDGKSFIFTILVPEQCDADFGVDHFIDFVYADYDNFPANIVVDGVSHALNLEEEQDGLVQTIRVPVPWVDLLDGMVEVTIDAVNEVYFAVDYVLLDADVLADSDSDCIPDEYDLCPDSTTSIVNSSGCSLDQLCPCEDNWENHGQFVKCTTAAAGQLLDEYVISKEEKNQIVMDNAKSGCGN